VSRPVTWAAPFVIKKMGVIYKITSPSGKVYVGQTKHKKINQRMSNHKSSRLNVEGKCAIIESIKKYGWDAHVVELVEENIPKKLLDEREIYWIAELKTYAKKYPERGLNLTEGGNHRPTWRDDAKRVAKARQRIGPNAPGWGKKVAEDVKRKIAKGVSKYNKANGVKPSAECHKKAKEAQYVPVVAYDRNGDFIGEYPYIKAAADALGLARKCVNDTVNGIQKHTKGYFFRRREEGYPMKIDVSGVKLQLKKRPVLCYVGEDVIEYANPNEAAAALGLWHQTIKDAANLDKPLRNGYRFVYKDSLNQNRPHIAGRAA
jgi:group I intron endonuclease